MKCSEWFPVGARLLQPSEGKAAKINKGKLRGGLATL
jgi:hypothetical protein